MKTLLRLASKKALSPILTTVNVLNGIAKASDLDCFIEYPVNGISNGLYSPHGFESDIARSKSDFATSEFPDLPEKGDALGSIRIDLSDFEYVSRAMSKEETRYYLCGINFIGNDMVATDGHRLHKAGLTNTVPVNRKFERGQIIQSDVVKYALSACKEEMTKEIEITFFDRWTVLKVGQYTITSKLVDGTYVDYARVIPQDHVKHTVFIQKEVQAVAKDIKALAKIDGARIPAVALDKGFISSYGKKFPISSKFTVPTGFNLNYLLAVQDGDVSYGEPDQPMLIKKDNLLSVLMPTRI